MSTTTLNQDTILELTSETCKLINLTKQELTPRTLRELQVQCTVILNSLTAFAYLEGISTEARITIEDTLN
jgi:hypothetical protein